MTDQQATGFRRPARKLSNLLNTQNPNDAATAQQNHHEYLSRKQNFWKRSFDLRKSVQIYGFNWSINGQVYVVFFQIYKQNFTINKFNLINLSQNSLKEVIAARIDPWLVGKEVLTQINVKEIKEILR